jgi:enamine deaminase RidA (YjgF/YER057c/UK114 family)
MALEIVEARLAQLGLQLPEPPPPVANYVGSVRTGNLVFVSGHGPHQKGGYRLVGKVDSEVGMSQAREAARLTMVNCLATLRAEIGSLDRVTRIVKLLGMVNSDPTFTRQAEVIDGASDLLEEVFGERGKHARSAVGMGALPMGIPVEIEMIVEVSEDT